MGLRGFRGGVNFFATTYVKGTSATAAIWMYYYDVTGHFSNPLVSGHTVTGGQWYNWTQRVVINTGSAGAWNADGIYELFIDGVMVFQITGITFTNDDTGGRSVDGFTFDTHPGEGNPVISSTRRQYFDDLVLWYYKPNQTGIPYRGDANGGLSQTGRDISGTIPAAANFGR